MIPLEIVVPTPPLFHHHILSHKSIFVNRRVEFNLVTGDGVHERHDNLEESVDEEGNVDDESEPETFGIVGLEDVEHFVGSAD